MAQTMTENTLFYGDNLAILREYVGEETVDLIYLDPPFNSQRTYNVLFKDESGEESEAQIAAFEDTWHWNQAAEATYHELVTAGPERVSRMVGALREFIGTNQMMAYLVMMAARLVELHRVLRPAGSLYLHCDPTASHYLKILMDTIFGVGNFRNEIIWKRTTAHSDSATLGNTHDVILYYSKSKKFTWNKQYQGHDESYIHSHYRRVDENGRKYRTDNLTAYGLSGGGYTYEWNGVTKLWRVPMERMKELHEQNRIHYTKSGGSEYIRYLDEMPGVPLQDVWVDLAPINSQAKERLGYPTQKPLALLERIIEASSNPGDVVLDPFCVTGDTLVVTRNGLRPIQAIQIGDEVLTHQGRYRRVTRLYQREYEGEMLTLSRARSNITLDITPNHPVLAVRAEYCPYEKGNRPCLPRFCRFHRAGKYLNCPRYRDAYRLEWIAAGDLREGDWVYYPATAIAAPERVALAPSGHADDKPIPASLPVTPSLMEWFGYFAAEGSVDEGGVHFINYKDADHIANLGATLFGLEATIKPQRRSRSKIIRFHSHALSQWMESTIGRRAAHKQLPEWSLGVDDDGRHALLRGLFRGDGSFRRDKPDDQSHTYYYGSASPTLAHQVMRLLLQEGVACGFYVSHPAKQEATMNVNGPAVRVHPSFYRVSAHDASSVNRLLETTQEAAPYREELVRQPSLSYPFAGGWLYTVKQIQRREMAATVYNLEVEEDNSYVTATFTVHNCGCGTTVAAAQKLGRRWIGIDVTHLSITLQKYRLQQMFPELAFRVIGEPQSVADARQLAQEDRYQFQWWALSLVGARPLGGEAQSKKGKKGADRGIDGVITFIDDRSGTPKRALAQVKSGKVKSGDVRDLAGAVQREKAVMGIFLTLEEPTREMRLEAVSAGYYRSPGWHQDYPKIQILTIGELLNGAAVQMPRLATAGVTFRAAERVKESGGEQKSLFE